MRKDRWEPEPKRLVVKTPFRFLGVAVSLVVAPIVENPLYLWDAYRSEDPNGLSPLGALLILSAARALLSVPGHVLFSSMWGYALGWSKFTREKRRARSLVRRGLALAIALHAVFNLLAVALLPFSAGVVVLSVVMWRMLRHRIHGALSRSPHRTERLS